MCVNATEPETLPLSHPLYQWEGEGWCDDLLATMKPQAVKESLGWPVGTLVHNKTNGRRASIRWSHGDRCSLQFADGIKNIWITTWDVVLHSYRPCN